MGADHLSGAAMLRIDGLRKAFGEKTVLDGLAFEVASGEVVSLLGANGSGKSTSLRCVVGLERPDGGTITVDGVTAKPGEAMPTVAMVFQKIHLVPRRSVLDNVCAGALGRLGLSRSWSVLAFPREVQAEAMACLDRVGLADRAREKAGRLSGGQQQRVAVARALCQRATVLLADEPVSALDPAASEQVMNLLRSLADDDGLAVAAVLHQPNLARRFSDRILGLAGGRLVFDSRSAEVTDETVASLYRPALEALEAAESAESAESAEMREYA
ncbi:ATP-binding cassette domain-containing protein [Nocardioides sp. KC13]|uniref:ATP-binding cassette domain-containing protein n=1 Tax=Nocardioides turkmenicus TaxID=2711220 RepID=A0A6M1RA02_9ACTN|nr:ATP-binding cassette domain-containing protein [Nocardioides sp. KC13]NGN94329.1 ATP-binding cassette domain-containing protein [Nocardioides sp. KC13]